MSVFEFLIVVLLAVGIGSTDRGVRLGAAVAAVFLAALAVTGVVPA